jgi:hypothetical protein
MPLQRVDSKRENGNGAIMNNSLSGRLQGNLERWVCVVLKIVACLHFELFYDIEHSHFFPLDVYADGKYMLPYQSRMLVGWILRYGVRLRPVQIIARHMPGSPQMKNPYEVLFLAISFFGMLGALYVTQMSLRVLTKDERFSRWACFGVLYMVMFNLSLSYGLGYTLPYDIPSLFFFCLCFYLVLTRKYLLYYLAFIVATFNRETTCFLTLFFLICEWLALKENPLRGKGKLIAHVFVQLVIWVGIKSYLTHLFRGNPVETQNNGVAMFRVGENIHFLLNPGQWPLLLSIFGFTLPLLVFGFRWIQDRRIRTACLLFFPLWFAVMMITGVIVEVRVFDELSALLSLACALIVYHWAESRGLRWKDSAALTA